MDARREASRSLAAFLLGVPKFFLAFAGVAANLLDSNNRDSLFIGLALELYRRRNGKWTGTLEELAPQWLPQVPVDRITGKPLHYKIVDDHPLIYSVGPDEDDDSGRALQKEVVPYSVDSTPDDGDWVIWLTAKK